MHDHCMCVVVYCVYMHMHFVSACQNALHEEFSPGFSKV